jgi:hypothetical protein
MLAFINFTIGNLRVSENSSFNDLQTQEIKTLDFEIEQPKPEESKTENLDFKIKK